MLARVHRRPPPSANCANTIWVNIGERSRTAVNETETETRGQAAHHGAARPRSAPGERGGDLVGAAPGPSPGRGGQPSTADKFVLVGLANHVGPDGTRQSCYAVGLHPCQFIWPSLYRGHQV